MLLLAGAKSVSSDSDACLACRAFARVFFSKPCFSSSAYSLMPRPFQHVQEGQGMRLEGICDFLYYCPGSPQGWGRNCETNALSIPAVVPRRGGGGGHIIDRCIIAREKSLYNHMYCCAEGLALQCLSLYSDFIQTFDILLQQVCECTFAAS